MRFLIEVKEEVRARCGNGFPVGVRLNPDDLAPGG
jgi:2,4-dienoyl-CoA reductase-like NADH-dependent reductase (Old Yellow Enzyme family)